MLPHLSKKSIKLFTFKSIKNRLAFWFFILGLTPLLLGMITTYRLQVRSIEKQTFAKLVAIRDLKVEHIESWLEERIYDVKTTATDNELNLLEQVIFKKEKDPNDLEIYKNTRKILNRYINSYDAYEELFIINPRTGIVEISTNQYSQGIDKSHDVYFTQPMKTRELFIKDIYYSKFSSKMIMTFSIPIVCSAHDGQHIIAILVARMNLEHSLYPLLQKRIGLGNTGETLIVNKKVKPLNTLRWYENTALNFQIKAQPAINAARGETGIIESKDYRGENVLAAYTYIPETGWGFICKQDVHELNRPIRQLLFYNMGICLFSAMAILMVVLWISRAISKPIVDMGIIAQKINHGDYAVRNEINSQDELGALARFINEMTESIASKITVQQSVLTISETMAGLSSMETFASELITVLIKTTHSNMGVFYTLNKEQTQFKHLSSMGANEKVLKVIDAQNPTGALDFAISNGQISHIKDIPGDTLFTFNTVAGDAIPKEILTIPILMGHKVTAIISLVNLNSYTKESLEILHQSWELINVSHAHLSASINTNTLAMDLSHSNKTLEAQAVELQEQSEELQQTAEELQEQNLELGAQRLQVEEANRLKSEFLSNMSHELRTPLNSVMALSRVLAMQAREKLSDEEINYLEIIERNGKNLLGLINDILDLSKIEAGRMEINPKPFQITSTIDTIIERLTPLAREKGIELHMTTPDALPQLNSDENRVHQILQNLISNAVKFTQQGKVFISVEQADQTMHVVVSDTGIGISKEELPYIFEEFRQVDGTSSRSYEGTGLGLAIASKTAGILGGDIDIKSTLGQGATFTLRLPLFHRDPPPILMPEALAVEPLGEIQPIHKPILVVDDDDESHSLPPIESPENTLKIVENRNRILMVEDNEAAIVQVKMFLKGQGYLVDVARGGQEALDYMLHTIPDGIILDLMMPQIDGFQVLEKMRSTPATANTPVLILTARDLTPEDLSHLSANHVQQLVQKGDIDPQGLLSKIQTMLGKSPPMENQSSKAHNRPSPSEPAPRDIKLPPHEYQPQRNGAEAVAPKENGSLKSTLLVVEDNPDNMITLKAILQKKYTLLEAVDGRKGLQMALTTQPDLILLDMSLPEMDGFSVVTRIKQDPKAAHIPVIALTAHAMKGDREKMIQAGCDDYLSKPIDPKKIIILINKWLKK